MTGPQRKPRAPRNGRRGPRIPKLPEPPWERYAALLRHYFIRLPPDITGSTAWDVFAGPDFDAQTHEVAPLFAHVMRRSGEDLAGFNDAQLGIGLQALFSFQWSNMAYWLANAPAYLRGGDLIPMGQQSAAIASIATLYRECLTPRLPADHPWGSGGPLSYFCYMLWDASPLGDWRGAGADDPRVAALLGVLKAGLDSPNPACVVSALHGLGHLSGVHDSVGQMIDDFLSRRASALPSTVVKYAREAKRGRI